MMCEMAVDQLVVACLGGVIGGCLSKLLILAVRTWWWRG